MAAIKVSDVFKCMKSIFSLFFKGRNTANRGRYGHFSDSTSRNDWGKKNIGFDKNPRDFQFKNNKDDAHFSGNRQYRYKNDNPRRSTEEQQPLSVEGTIIDSTGYTLVKFFFNRSRCWAT